MERVKETKRVQSDDAGMVERFLNCTFSGGMPHVVCLKATNKNNTARKKRREKYLLFFRPLAVEFVDFESYRPQLDQIIRFIHLGSKK